MSTIALQAFHGIQGFTDKSFQIKGGRHRLDQPARGAYHLY